MFAVFSVSAARGHDGCLWPARSLAHHFFFRTGFFAARSFSDVGLPSSRFSALAALIQSQSIKPPPLPLRPLCSCRAHTRGEMSSGQNSTRAIPLPSLFSPLALCLGLPPSSQSEPTNQHTHSHTHHTIRICYKHHIPSFIIDPFDQPVSPFTSSEIILSTPLPVGTSLSLLLFFSLLLSLSLQIALEGTSPLETRRCRQTATPQQTTTLSLFVVILFFLYNIFIPHRSSTRLIPVAPYNL